MGDSRIEEELEEVEMAEAEAGTSGPLDQGMEDFELTGFARGEFTHRLANFSSQVTTDLPTQVQLYSDEFEIAGYSWRLLVYPAGNPTNRNAQTNQRHMSVYLDCPEAAMLPHQLLPSAKFTLTVINHNDPAASIKKDTEHRFGPKEVDWGFTSFMELADAKSPEKGFLVDDAITVKVEIEVQLEEKFTGQTRQTTGFVGLKNQGATCYMNSLLQMLFHMPLFRQAVYHMPTAEDEDPKSSISLALQSLFFRLQYSKTPVSTKDLIHSFGWNTMDAFQQHDVEELELKLCEKLEQKMKGTKVDKAMNRLLMGKFYNYIDCLNVDFKSSRTEEFLDIQLPVMECKDVYTSFDRIVDVETMDGDNKYHAEGHGLQDARKGVLLEVLPPILQLHLKRFDYDRQTWMPIKVNDRYEFYDTLDLDVDNYKYLSPDCDRSIRNLYKLHSVLVHMGGSHGGHYYAYIRPDGKQFYKFDDEAVTKEEDSAAIQGQFGGEPEPSTQLGTGQMRMKARNSSNAYMLVYVRESDWDQVMCNAGAEHLMEHVSSRLRAEQADKERKRREKLQAHRFVTIKVVTDSDIAEHVRTESFDLCKFDDRSPSHTFKFPKTETWENVTAEIGRVTGTDTSKHMYWRWSMRENTTYRPATLLEVDPHQPIKFKHREIVNFMKQHSGNNQGAFSRGSTTLAPIELYLGTLDTHIQETREMVLLFIKFYVPEENKLAFWKSLYVPANITLQQIADHVKTQVFADREPECEFEMFEEVRTDKCMVEPLTMTSTIKALDCKHGDVYILQPRLDEYEVEACSFPSVVNFLQHLHSLRKINFVPLLDTSAPGQLLEVPKDADYLAVVERLARAVKCPDPHLIRLTQHSAYTNQPVRNHVKYNESFMHANAAAAAVQTVYYEVLDMPLPELEQLKTMSVTVVKESTELFKTLSLRLSRDATVSELIERVKSQLDPNFAGGQPLRVVKILEGKVYGVLAPEESVLDLNSSYWELRAEPVPADDEAAVEAAGDAAQRVAVSHIFDEGKGPGLLAYGDPLTLMLCPHEELRSLKARVLKRLKVAPEEFATWKWAIVTHQQTELLSDDSQPVLEVWERLTHGSANQLDSCYIGMHHESKNFRRPPRQAHCASAEAQIKLL